MEIEVNVNTTARFTSSPETFTWNSNVYAPVPMAIGEEEQSADGSLPRVFVDVSNHAGMAFRFAKDNDLSLQDVTIRMVNVAFPNSGDDARITMQILGAVFMDDVARFNLGFRFNFDAGGPTRTFDRVNFPSIPQDFRSFVII